MDDTKIRETSPAKPGCSCDAKFHAVDVQGPVSTASLDTVSSFSSFSDALQVGLRPSLELLDADTHFKVCLYWILGVEAAIRRVSEGRVKRFQ